MRKYIMVYIQKMRKVCQAGGAVREGVCGTGTCRDVSIRAVGIVITYY
jgi:hypothetical protein